EQDIAANGHTPADAVPENNVDPDCTNTGSYDSVVYCTECGTELSRENVIVNAKGHSWGDWETVTEAGQYTNGEKKHTCTECQVTEYDIIPATDHVHSIEMVKLESPTCTEDGNIRYFECTHCHTFYKDAAGTEVIDDKDSVKLPANGHKPGQPVQENKNDATCTENGSYDEVTYCTECLQEVKRENKTIEADGHDFSEWVVTTEPTLTSEGEKTRVFSKCGATETEPVDKLIYKPAKPTAEIKIAFGGRTVKLDCADEDALIYYIFGSSEIDTSCEYIAAGETIFLDEPMTGNSAAMYFKAYKNDTWSDLGKWGVLNVKIAAPLIVKSGPASANRYKIYTQTKNSYIIYTTDGSEPSIEEGIQQLQIKNGKIIWGTSGVITVSEGDTIKAIAVRSGLVTSEVLEYTDD
ncbi:MAG: chitobiase/beta-hexosaminidase C-terminal domain-containing protein, partial [Oscillospiraceae bacterium]|nr:chitobiase/beta-hexosaminidase C-terminal domain-containing protein [Oscillospiraceae bacterium]